MAPSAQPLEGMRRSVRPGVVEVVENKAKLPDEWKDARILETCSIADVPTEADLKAWLSDRGLETNDWGEGNTKPVKKLWLELKDSESGLELWQKANGTMDIVRVTHVLRAKVCSPESYKRGIFLFNTWQQRGDGVERIRNGLLSEKLTTAEMPLNENLHEVCERAVTQEEMQRVKEALFKLTPGSPPPAYDPDYKCPITVVDEYFCDHVVEVEASRSYPRLITMYHLYTVDIVCTGLPSVDFTTLEFDHPDEKGHRKLKYVHAWVWKEWSEVQRYLFEGSVLKERKIKGSFADAGELRSWLSVFNLDLSSWGQKGTKSADDLYRELQDEEAQLEMWGRDDGAPLLMRVVHVLQMKLSSPDSRLKGKFLYNTCIQTADGTQKSVNRLMSTKLSTRKVPFNSERFCEETQLAVNTLLVYVVDAFFRMDPANPPKVESLERVKPSVLQVQLVDHHVDVDMSPTFKGLCTLYHLYTCSAIVDGLPPSGFATLDVRYDSQQSEPSVRSVMCWCWCTWPQCLDLVHNRQREMDEELEGCKESLGSKMEAMSENVRTAQELQSKLAELKASAPASEAKEYEELEALAAEMLRKYQDMQAAMSAAQTNANRASIKRTVPPSIVSELAEKAMVATDDILCKSI